ncbi:NAD(P)/FAD-dependent oxidoreductase [Helicobacter canis]|uniref:NADH:ubiquinone reductase (non-electrogenic) n=1 Tax=Helicobacter canis TaxID=29419 RepID=A0A5M9QNI9_9HELI|nr:FAD-dependent oxidoreductase [Helicobacter canis]KAA8709609.1 NAD(P)/FAD-dependent oxidoreductase [Helicobacter canis]
MKTPHIVFLGAGYATLSCIASLPKSIYNSAKWTLITKDSTHYESVLLHEVASGYKDREILHKLQDILPKDIEIVQDCVRTINASSKQIICECGTYSYDVLILGLGFASDSFGISGVSEYALPLTNYHQAKAIHAKIEANLQAYTRTSDARYLRFVVCGGGFSGCELVATLSQEIPKQAKKLGIQQPIECVCIEALDNVLPMFSPTLAQKGRKYLEKLGVKVLSASKILSVLENGVQIACANEQQGPQTTLIESFCTIWTAGVQGSLVIANSFGTPKSKLVITPYLHPKSLESSDSNAAKDSSADMELESIFVLGDCSALLDEKTQRFYPPTAQLAQQQGIYLASILATYLQQYAAKDSAKVDSSAPIPPFSYKPQGTICSLGHSYGVGEVSGREVSGLIAIAIKRAIEWRWRRKIKAGKSR